MCTVARLPTPPNTTGKDRRERQRSGAAPSLLGVEDWVYFDVPDARDQRLVEGELRGGWLWGVVWWVSGGDV